MLRTIATMQKLPHLGLAQVRMSDHYPEPLRCQVRCFLLVLFERYDCKIICNFVRGRFFYLPAFSARDWQLDLPQLCINMYNCQMPATTTKFDTFLVGTMLMNRNIKLNFA